MKNFWSLAVLGIVVNACMFCAADAVAPANGEALLPQRPGVRLMALASGQWLTQQVGQYDPAHGWIRNDTYLDRPLQGTVYTLFGLAGKLAEVKTIDPMRLDPDGIAWDWSAQISAWPQQAQEQALAFKGSWPAPPRIAQALPLDDPSAVRAAADFLKHRRLDVEQPYLTQVFTVDLLGDGREERIICAHSDRSALADAPSASIYAVVLILFDRDGQTVALPLAAYTAFKPAGRHLEEQESLYGRSPFYRLIAFPDIMGDGHLEIVFTRNLEHMPSTTIEAFDGKTLKKILSSYTIE